MIHSCLPSERKLGGRIPVAAVLAGLIFALLFALYGFTAAPSVTFHDSGELITAAATLGIPHPPGSPTWCLLAHPFTWLPWGSPGFRVNLSSAFFAALAGALVYLLVQRVLRRIAEPSQVRWTHWAGVFAALTLGQVPAFWEKAVQTEIYAANASFQVLLLYLLELWLTTADAAAAPDQPPHPAAVSRRERWLLAALATMLGLGAGNYLALLYYAPILALAVVWRRRVILRDWRSWLLAGAAFGLGLAVFLYLSVRSLANPPIDWGNPETLGNWLSVMKRERWGDFTFSSQSWEFILLWLQTYAFPAQLGWLAVLLALFGLAYCRRRLGLTCVVYLGFFAVYLVIMLWMQATTPVLVADLYYVKTYGMTEFHIPLYVMVAILSGFGAFGLAAVAQRRLPSHAPFSQPSTPPGQGVPAAARLAPALVWVVGGAILGFQYANNFSACNYRQYQAPVEYGRALAASVPKGAWVVPGSDNDLGVLGYLKFVERSETNYSLLTLSAVGRQWLEQAAQTNASAGVWLGRALQARPRQFLDAIFNEPLPDRNAVPEICFTKCPKAEPLARQLYPDGLVFRFGSRPAAQPTRQREFWREFLARPTFYLPEENIGQPRMKADARENLYLLLVNHAFWHELTGEFAMASYLTHQALLCAPESIHADLYARLAACALELKRPEKAFEYGLAALRRDPRQVAALHTVAIVCVGWKQYDAAIDCFERILAVDPANAAARANLKTARQERQTMDEKGKNH